VAGPASRGALGAFAIALLAGTVGCVGELAPAPKLILVWGESGSAPGELHQPIGIAVAEEGSVFVADTGNDRIEVFDPDGKFLRAFGSRGEKPGEFRRPMDIDIDAQGRLYVAEHGGDRVQVFSHDGDWLRGLRAEDVPGGEFDAAAGVAVTPSGEIYVADFYNHRVVAFRKDGSFRAVIGLPGRVLPGRLHYPTDLEWSEGRLVVADAYNNRIQVFTENGEAIARWGGILGSGLPGGGPRSFRVATGVAADALGRIYVADFENHRIQVFTRDGKLLAVFGSRGSGPGEFERPTDLDIGADGRIYVIDFGNDRVQVFEPLSKAVP